MRVLGTPVTGGQRWSCRFRRAEPLCKHLGGPAAPTIPSPEDWPWDKVGTAETSRSEARALEAAWSGDAPPSAGGGPDAEGGPDAQP